MNDIVKFTKDSLYQRLKASFLYDDYELSLKDTEKRDELLRIWSLRYRNKYSRPQIIKILMRPDENGKRMSHATAYRNYLLAQEIYGEIDQVNIAAERAFLYEAFHEQYLSAKKKGKEKEAISALKELKSLTDFSPEQNLVDPKKLEASVFKLNLPRGANKILTKMFESGIVDFNNIGAEDVECKDAETEENEENEEEDGI